MFIHNYREPPNNYELCIMNYELKKDHNILNPS